ncbi:Low choriolytic enzyme [Collichthys lucidus]|uniref:Low choriolytic enzyme n=1 Tax=Collichthys lucidus TaxID=240159 RepID=A0A4U5TX48_COLLU|nr:Low choriolytic enzyme [Collichthys lucidus]
MKCLKEPRACLWPKSANGNVEIPFLISEKYDQAERNTILTAMKDFASKTCIRFIPRTTQTRHISIEPRLGTAFGMHGSETITPFPNSSVPIGQRDRLSNFDILKINKLYKCWNYLCCRDLTKEIKQLKAQVTILEACVGRYKVKKDAGFVLATAVSSSEEEEPRKPSSHSPKSSSSPNGGSSHLPPPPKMKRRSSPPRHLPPHPLTRKNPHTPSSKSRLFSHLRRPTVPPKRRPNPKTSLPRKLPRLWLPKNWSRKNNRRGCSQPSSPTSAPELRSKLKDILLCTSLDSYIQEYAEFVFCPEGTNKMQDNAVSKASRAKTFLTFLQLGWPNITYWMWDFVFNVPLIKIYPSVLRKVGLAPTPVVLYVGQAISFVEYFRSTPPKHSRVTSGQTKLVVRELRKLHMDLGWTVLGHQGQRPSRRHRYNFFGYLVAYLSSIYGHRTRVLTRMRVKEVREAVGDGERGYLINLRHPSHVNFGTILSDGFEGNDLRAETRNACFTTLGLRHGAMRTWREVFNNV